MGQKGHRCPTASTASECLSPSVRARVHPLTALPLPVPPMPAPRASVTHLQAWHTDTVGTPSVSPYTSVHACVHTRTHPLPPQPACTQSAVTHSSLMVTTTLTDRVQMSLPLVHSRQHALESDSRGTPCQHPHPATSPSLDHRHLTPAQSQAPHNTYTHP